MSFTIFTEAVNLVPNLQLLISRGEFVNEDVKILVVDDNPYNTSALQELLLGPGIRIFIAFNSDEALEILYRHDLDLAFLDVELPGMDGLELARLIRGVRRFKNLPIIFATARPADASLIFQGYQSGAVDVLFKPLDPDTVRAKVQVFVELARAKNSLKAQLESLPDPELLQRTRDLLLEITEGKTPSIEAAKEIARSFETALPDLNLASSASGSEKPSRLNG